MKLYYHPLSPNVRRARLTAAVLGLKLDEHLVDFSKGEHKSPDFLALNPNGALPTLVDGDFALSESRAIMQYLASQKPEAGLFPADARARADVTRWMFWDASHFSPALATVAFERLLKKMMGMGEADAAKVDEALKNLRRWGGVLNSHLAGRAFVVGDALTLADLTLAASLMYAKQAEIPLAELPHLAAWFDRMTALDGWAQSA